MLPWVLNGSATHGKGPQINIDLTHKGLSTAFTDIHSRVFAIWNGYPLALGKNNPS